MITVEIPIKDPKKPPKLVFPDRCVNCGNVTWIPFFVVGLLVCVVVFVPVWLLAPEGSMPQTHTFPYMLGAFAGMVAGMIVGTLVEFVLRLSFAPSYGKLLLQRPLTIFSIFTDSEDLIGISTRFEDNKKILNVGFENDEMAREFVSLNPQENG